MKYKFGSSVKFGSQKFTLPIIILLVLLISRLAANFATVTIISMIISIAYFAALLGILIEKKWGYLVAMGLAGIDVLFLLVLIGGFDAIFFISALAIDVAILYLAYREYKK